MPRKHHSFSREPDRIHPVFLIGLIMVTLASLASAQDKQPFHLILTEGSVSISRNNADWKSLSVKPPKAIALNPGDRIRTGEHSRATIEVSGTRVIHLNELTVWGLRRADEPRRAGVEVEVSRGLMYFLSREARKDIRVRTPSSVGALRGTEFTVQVGPNGRTIYTMLAGGLAVSNQFGQLDITGGQAAEVIPGQAPKLQAAIKAHRVVQWHLYYPAVVDAADLQLTPGEQAAFASSLKAYRAGDVLRAFESFPWQRPIKPRSDAAVFRASLLLTTGQFDEINLNALGSSRSANAVRRLVSVVTSEPSARPDSEQQQGDKNPIESQDKTPVARASSSASEHLAASYEHQAAGQLPAALNEAVRSTALSPEFAFAWARRGELEFALGKRRAAAQSLQKALSTGPRNAQAWALQGFVASALQRWPEAHQAFSTATQLDASLGNGWLGLGLLAFRQGDPATGRRHLLMAAAQEPDRALLRSYLARGLAEDGNLPLAAEEAERGKTLDPNDPSSWLQSSRIHQRKQAFRDAIQDLERSIRLNNNRRLFRSDLQLAQDEAMRRTNLAQLYDRVGMEERSIQQASWAVLGDYTNAEAHLFLANGYDRLRDPFGIELEYDAAWQNEILLANLLSPPGAGVVSRRIGLQEYGPFFTRPGGSGVFRSRYQDNGDFLLEFDHQQLGENGSFALSLDHRELNGYRPNNDASQSSANLLLKRQISTQDALFLEVGWSEFDGGDLLRLPLAGLGRPNLHLDEELSPSLRLGATHRWENDATTIFLTGFSRARQDFSDKDVSAVNVNRNAMGVVIGTAPVSMDLRKQTDIDLFSTQLSHIQQFGTLQLVVGAEFQSGDVTTHDVVSNPPAALAPFFNTPPSDARVTESLEHSKVYTHATWQPNDQLTLQGGLTYDWLTYPANYRSSPITPGEEDRDDLSVNGGLLWQPTERLSLWSAYAQSAGGITFDESLSLEPSQTVGMLHNYRSLISESLVGSLAAPQHEVAGAGLSWQAHDNLYLDLSYRWRSAEIDRLRGVFTRQGLPPLLPDTTPETLDYEDHQLQAKLTWLLANQWSASLGYTWTRADLAQSFPEFPDGGGIPPGYDLESNLHEVEARLLWNHPSGLFGETSARFLSQNNTTFPDDSGLILDLASGYAPPGLGGRFRFGVLNATDNDYLPNPLTDRTAPVTARTFFIEYIHSY